ncbi:hypothetical protein ACIQXW_07195 [Lysinibacillus sp. NPDC097162]|uniref:hypothetical protein n=1 Tax=Lysinibacillus sp. NPDC097162 TaxID=3364140 RepID=UPI0038046D62
MWSIWHLPLWFIVGSNQTSMNFLWFTLIALALSFLMTIISQYTKSIFLFHALINSFWEVYIPNSNLSSGLLTLVFALIIFIAFEVYQKKNIAKCHHFLHG